MIQSVLRAGWNEKLLHRKFCTFFYFLGLDIRWFLLLFQNQYRLRAKYRLYILDHFQKLQDFIY